MTETPPPMQGQIDAPNPLELFWEKNKKLVIGAGIAVAAALAVNYGLQYMERQTRNANWSALAASSGLDEAYTREGKLWDFFSQQISQNPAAIRQYVIYARGELIERVGEDLAEADASELESIVEAGGSRAPLALWTLAVKRYEDEDWDGALAALDRLEKNHPDHLLVKQSEYPVQFRPEVEKEEEEEPDETPSPANEEPELEPAVAGSDVARLRAAIQSQKDFRAANPRFYEAPKPTSEQTLVLEIENAGTIRIKLYDELAPKHAAALLEIAGTDFFVGQRIHEIRREPGTTSPFSQPAGEMVFGWKATKEEDREQWEPGEVDEEHLVDWESTGLSHFPFMVAVESATEGKSQVERIVINSVDLGQLRDGSRVIVGRVVEGQDVVEEIVQSGFSDATELEAGRGRPEETYTISSVTIE